MSGIRAKRAMAAAVESGLLSQEEAAEFVDALDKISAQVTVAGDQAGAMTNAELGELLLRGRWTTVEIHEAGRRLRACVCAKPRGEIVALGDDACVCAETSVRNCPVHAPRDAA